MIMKSYILPVNRELLRGPLYYVLVLMISSLIFWRESPIGIISLAMMSGGDGNFMVVACFYYFDSPKNIYMLYRFC